MSKTCARCEKTVYPIEELKCLDKIWHKQCFKCQGCGMTLNMRTYKGFNKQPYCEAHIPKAKATTMAETPELKRIAENTKIQSNVKYHAEFEKAKGKFTQVADDPETLRIKQNSKIISNVAYHGDLEKKAIMEQKRTMTGENGEQIVTNPPTRKIGSVADIDPVNEYYGSLTPATTINNNQHQLQHQPPPPPPNVGRVYRAMYDYEAQDLDEVSFCDGDLIINCTAVDEGWMTGLVQRTGRHGMLPANYVEPAQI
ncbi:LIM and SH3 domain protein Lasp isoform X2 [Cataglyphis hispanica]|uniref:LIM and SH3 domain protein Lasp isoform X2 n=1 Tax=Cataglyphis hispanica TaxID=1086592 RepID=UPI0021804367|nr:LIM and SH3 domain protein Lasp isoform X2 [Cataglyphis hispanica]